MSLIEIDDEESLERALKRLKRVVEKEGIIREWKRREYFEKPSLVKSRKHKALLRKQAKRLRRINKK